MYSYISVIPFFDNIVNFCNDSSVFMFLSFVIFIYCDTFIKLALGQKADLFNNKQHTYVKEKSIRRVQARRNVSNPHFMAAV